MYQTDLFQVPSSFFDRQKCSEKQILTSFQSFPRAVFELFSQQAINNSAEAIAGGSQLCHLHSRHNDRDRFFSKPRQTAEDEK